MLCRICLCVMALLFYGGQTQECNRCPNEFLHLPNENKCYKVIPSLVTWEAAFKICDELGAHLVVIKNSETNIALRAAFTPFKGSCPRDKHKSSAFWTAGRYPCKGTPPFKWSTGSGNLLNIGYTNWRKGEPNNSGGVEDCLQVIDDDIHFYGWNDENCFDKYCPICEIDI